MCIILLALSVTYCLCHLLNCNYSFQELSKELQVCRKKIETYEGSQAALLGEGSRSSSNISLNNVEASENKSASSQASPVTVQTSLPTEPDKQVLIDKIVKVPSYAVVFFTPVIYNIYQYVSHRIC